MSGKEDSIDKNSPTYLFAAISTQLDIVIKMVNEIKAQLLEGQEKFASIEAQLALHEKAIAELKTTMFVKTQTVPLPQDSATKPPDPSEEQIELALLRILGRVIMAHWGKIATVAGGAVISVWTYLKSQGGHQ